MAYQRRGHRRYARMHWMHAEQHPQLKNEDLGSLALQQHKQPKKQS